MKLGIFSYTATILFFNGFALLLYFAFARKSSKLSTSDLKVILLTILIGTIATGPGEWVALTWKTWTYNPERTFHTTLFGAELETYLFTILVSLVVSIATLAYARREDQKRNSM